MALTHVETTIPWRIVAILCMKQTPLVGTSTGKVKKSDQTVQLTGVV